MELTEQQKKDYLEGEANSAVPLAAVNTGLWPKVIPYSWDEKLGKYLLVDNLLNMCSVLIGNMLEISD